jgi:uncharacterized membrane protein
MTGNNRKLLTAIGAFIFFTILFCLPGSALPKEDLFSKIWIDKWVHIGIFTTLLFLWCGVVVPGHFKSYLLLIFFAVLYGYLIEVIQDRFIPNRSFDWGDLLADFVGSVIGLLVWRRYKKIDPCRNRGRNQN